jgi:hypothetical protein
MFLNHRHGILELAITREPNGHAKVLDGVAPQTACLHVFKTSDDFIGKFGGQK